MLLGASSCSTTPVQPLAAATCTEFFPRGFNFFFSPSKPFSHSQGRGGKHGQAVLEPRAVSSKAGQAPDTHGVKSKLVSAPPPPPALKTEKEKKNHH